MSEIQFNRRQIIDLEKFADRILEKFDIDVEFSKHFGERLSDPRNNPSIQISELQKLFRKIERDEGKKVKQADHEAVLKDLQSDLNLPFVLNRKKNGEYEIVLKTIMRKKNFMSTNKEVKYESTSNEFHGMSFSEYINEERKKEKLVDKTKTKIVINPEVKATKK